MPLGLSNTAAAELADTPLFAMATTAAIIFTLTGVGAAATMAFIRCQASIPEAAVLAVATITLRTTKLPSLALSLPQISPRLRTFHTPSAEHKTLP